ncbi:MAG: hypothetical protein GQ574_18445 [Crocinitomix sp.]|nr:hypothetical protein [Crocinitomix sp.]
MNRTEIDTLIKKNSGQIALVAGVVGVMPHLLAFLPELSDALLDILIPFLLIAGPVVHFNVGDSYILMEFNQYSGLSYNYMSILFYGLILYGYFLHINKSNSNSKVLLFTFSIILISHVVGFLFIVLNVMLPSNWEYYNWISILHIASTITWAYMSFVICKSLLNVDQEPTEIRAAENVLDEVDAVLRKPDHGTRATINERLLHYIIDMLLYATLCTTGTFYFVGNIFMFNGWTLGDNSVLLMLMLIGQFLYYPFFEVVLGTTPGKILTGSIVVKEDGSKLKLKDAMNRTLVRVVPFEPFSFFSNGSGWHDKWTKTKVVKGKFEDGENRGELNEFDDFDDSNI